MTVTGKTAGLKSGGNFRLTFVRKVSSNVLLLSRPPGCVDGDPAGFGGRQNETLQTSDTWAVLSCLNTHFSMAVPFSALSVRQ